MPSLDPQPQGVELDAEQRDRIVSTTRRRLREFTEPFTNLEPWWRWDSMMDRWENTPAGTHVVTFPPLLDQLAAAIEGVAGASQSTGTFESRMVISADAIDARRLLDAGASSLLTSMGSPPSDLDVAAMLRTLAERAPTLDDVALVAFERTVRGWWVMVKVVSGFEERPQTPHVRCPVCNKQDTIRVRLDVAGKTGVAWCRECRADWDDSNLGLLIAEIERAHDEPDEEADGDDVEPRRRVDYVFVGSRAEAKRWAHANGIDPTKVCDVAHRWTFGIPGVDAAEPLPRVVVDGLSRHDPDLARELIRHGLTDATRRALSA